MENNPRINPRDESQITVPLDGCIDILDRIEESYSQGDIRVTSFFEALFIRLRHLTSYFTRGNSPFYSYKNKFEKSDLELIEKITSLRVAAAHPELDENWLNEHVMIIGAQIFKESDVEIQYGAHRAYLLKEIVPIYKKIREVFANSPELSHLKTFRSWDMDNQKIAEIEKSLRASLDISQVQKLLKRE